MDDRLEALERLARLRESGLLTEAELAAEKVRILGAAETAAPAPAPVAPARSVPSPAPGPGFVSRHRWILGGGVAAIVVTAILVYLVFTLPPAAIGNQSADSGAELGGESAVPEGTPDLATLLQGETSTCGFGEELRTILRNAAPADLRAGDVMTVGAVDVPGFAEPIAPRVRKLAGATQSAPQATIVDLFTPGVWHGLRVRRVRTISWAGTQISAVQIRFSERTNRVRQVLNGAGFGLPPAGQLRSVDGEERSVAMGIEAVPGGTAFVCAQDVVAPPATQG